ncbi:MAG: aminotransferase class I/II-fold pyridoxal phosphate-dependent enzyme [Candidatus Palauibacterales bacterium]|nr:aminotransferase class I/II-fold pyridoxal phosphate-dependent enzyme [Candidatus Palauibacterales bacterium]MDP2528906.1 aminotransferase class I/II-fold pyridoxal phosphate-dependent enzyme [Candidatus Palauibacterales bacterium]MDP2584052.1 aminotransferase class I/II-fold pyridoxal phosphate-dependent enzyme [Candidatus Palauibacterales bacterium]
MEDSEERSRGPLDMDPETMRKLGHAVVDRVVDRWAGLAGSRAGRTATRREMEERLREPLPKAGQPIEPLLERFWSDIEPFSMRSDHPGFFAFIPSSPTFASVLGDWLASGCNLFQGTWLESAGPSEVELVVLDWLKECVGLPAQAEGLLTSGGSAANLGGLAAARQAVLGGRPEGVAYLSDQAHTAVDRALRILGFPNECIRRLPAGEDFRLRTDDVRAAVREDRARGRRPFCVVATAGTTNTGAVDPLPALAELCAREGLWLHVDGAYGAFARVTVRGRRSLEGLERADSLVLDPHKWMYVGFEVGCLLVRRPGVLLETFRVLPEYLQDAAVRRGEVNFADLGLQLTRSARAIKLWLHMKHHGLAGLIAAVDRTQHLAELAGRRVASEPGLELTSAPSLGILTFRWVGDPGPEGRPALDGTEADARNRAIVERLTEEGRFMVSSTRLRGRYVLRLCPLGYRTTASDIDALLDDVLRLGAEESGDET